MIKKEHIIILLLIAIISILIFGIMNLHPSDNSTEIKNTTVSYETIANDTANDKGFVQVIRNIGNPEGKKIAYVVGVHPLENETHRTLLNMLPGIDDLKCNYDIYIINVTEDIGHYGDGSSDNSPGRQNGQNLALKYVYPEIADGDYELAIDIHSNIGAYPYKTFVFSPVKEGLGVDYAREVAEKCENISYYPLESTTSGPYLTVPLNEKGVPAFYLEEYSFAPQSEKNMHMLELISAVDNLEFN